VLLVCTIGGAQQNIDRTYIHMHQTSTIELAILMPYLNEAEALVVCVNRAFGCFEGSSLAGDALIADNGSTDGSEQIADSLGAKVKDIADTGYVGARNGGIEHVLGTYVVMGDADDSYDFSSLDDFVERLSAGDELVMGNRFRGGIEPGAISPLRKFLGTPVLSWIGSWLFLIPGTAAFVLGFVGVMLLGFGPVVFGRIGFTYSSQLYLAALTVVGFQSVLFAIPAALIMMLGSQTIMAGMFLGVLSVGVKRR